MASKREAGLPKVALSMAILTKLQHLPKGYISCLFPIDAVVSMMTNPN